MTEMLFVDSLVGDAFYNIILMIPVCESIKSMNKSFKVYLSCSADIACLVLSVIRVSKASSRYMMASLALAPGPSFFRARARPR